MLEFHAVPAALSATNELFSGERRLTMAEHAHAHSLPPDEDEAGTGRSEEV
jgi:hypothetical protein